jgi:hypothetical protein
MSTETTTGELHCSSSAYTPAEGVSDAQVRTGEGNYDLRCVITLPPLVGIRYALPGLRFELQIFFTIDELRHLNFARMGESFQRCCPEARR